MSQAQALISCRRVVTRPKRPLRSPHRCLPNPPTSARRSGTPRIATSAGTQCRLPSLLGPALRPETAVVKGRSLRRLPCAVSLRLVGAGQLLSSVLGTGARPEDRPVLSRPASRPASPARCTGIVRPLSLRPKEQASRHSRRRQRRLCERSSVPTHGELFFLCFFDINKAIVSARDVPALRVAERS